MEFLSKENNRKILFLLPACKPYWTAHPARESPALSIADPSEIWRIKSAAFWRRLRSPLDPFFLSNRVELIE